MTKKVIVAGWGQITQGKEQKENLLDTLGLMAEASLAATETAGSPDILKKLDGLMVVRPLSTHYPSLAKQLSEKIGSDPRFTMISKIGGNSPQSLVNKAAGMIARGELESVLITGAETYYPRNKKNIVRESALFKGLTGNYERDDMVGSTDAEARHGVSLPVHGFPLYETALWAESGMEISSYLQEVGKRWSEFSRIAAKHPNAWTKAPRSPDEIISTDNVNRLIAFPYTKFMNPLISVDLGAAIILMSDDKARQFRQKERQDVYFRGGAYAEDRQRFLIQKSGFTSSHSLKAAAQKALQRSKMSLDEIDCFDLYSCFPCSVSVACKMLGIRKSDPRPLTLTGGLGFFGGPGNNYSLHAIATLAEAISHGIYNNGLVTSLGWFMHKHAAGVYSAYPQNTGLQYHDLDDENDFLAGEEPVKIAEEVSGKGEIETYTIICSKDGVPAYAVIYGKTNKGFRFIARTRHDPNIFKALSTQRYVGRQVHLKYDADKKLNIAELL